LTDVKCIEKTASRDDDDTNMRTIMTYVPAGVLMARTSSSPALDKRYITQHPLHKHYTQKLNPRHKLQL